MDIRTGQIYDSLAAALTAGVPESDIAEIHEKFNPDGPHAPVRHSGRRRMLAEMTECPEVSFGSGPFKGRAYKRTATGQLVRCK